MYNVHCFVTSHTIICIIVFTHPYKSSIGFYFFLLSTILLPIFDRLFLLHLVYLMRFWTFCTSQDGSFPHILQPPKHYTLHHFFLLPSFHASVDPYLFPLSLFFLIHFLLLHFFFLLPLFLFLPSVLFITTDSATFFSSINHKLS